ncbi:unnamed protein product [Allacma fusca]|uniref:Reverse transcriptase/retrotransposon-derived protein RNase H-like domain-containing protein n=1 Tax=Allacma fusca TaxID=39272 RepID=A0A8J2KAU6_9HEXA|nr:unnamed protein product [Allacma fusca]
MIFDDHKAKHIILLMPVVLPYRNPKYGVKIGKYSKTRDIFVRIAEDPRITFIRDLAYQFLRTETCVHTDDTHFQLPEASTDNKIMPLENTFHFSNTMNRHYPEMAMYPVILDMMCQHLLKYENIHLSDNERVHPKTEQSEESSHEHKDDQVQINRSTMRALVQLLAERIHCSPISGEYERREYIPDGHKGSFHKITYDPPAKAAKFSRLYDYNSPLGRKQIAQDGDKKRTIVKDEAKKSPTNDRLNEYLVNMADIEDLYTHTVKIVDDGTKPPEIKLRKLVEIPVSMANIADNAKYYAYDSPLGPKTIKVSKDNKIEICDDQALKCDPNIELNKAILELDDIMKLNTHNIRFIPQETKGGFDPPLVMLEKHDPNDGEHYYNVVEITKPEIENINENTLENDTDSGFDEPDDVVPTFEIHNVGINVIPTVNEDNVTQDSVPQLPSLMKIDHITAIPIFINDMPLPAQLDSGALPNVMTKTLVDYITREHPQWIRYVKLNNPVNLRMADNSLVKAMTHCVEICVRLGTHMVCMPFYVLDTTGKSLLIGRLSMRHLGIVINHREGHEYAECHPKKAKSFKIPYLNKTEINDIYPVKKIAVLRKNKREAIRLISQNTFYMDEDWAHEQNQARELYLKNMRTDLNNLVIKGDITLQEANDAWDKLKTYSDIFSFNAGRYRGETVKFKFKDGKIPPLGLWRDDVKVSGSTFKETLDRLLYVFDKIRENGLKLNPNKTQFFRNYAEHLGFVLSKDEVAKQSEKVKKFMEFVNKHQKNGKFHITTVKQLLQLVGLTGLYRNFIPNYMQILAPIYATTQGKNAKDGKIEWGELQEKAFEELKAEYCKDFKIQPPPPTGELCLDTHVTDDAMNAVLFYITIDPVTEQEIKHVCLYVSIAFEEHQKHFTPFDKDMMALVQVLKRLQMWVHGRIINVKSHLLATINRYREMMQTHRKAAYWITMLNCFDLRFKLNTSNRMLYVLQAPELEIKNFQTLITTFDINFLDENVPMLITKLSDIARYQQKDDTCAKLIKKLRKYHSPDKKAEIEAKKKLLKRFTLREMKTTEEISSSPDTRSESDTTQKKVKMKVIDVAREQRLNLRNLKKFDTQLYESIMSSTTHSSEEKTQKQKARIKRKKKYKKRKKAELKPTPTLTPKKKKPSVADRIKNTAQATSLITNTNNPPPSTSRAQPTGAGYPTPTPKQDKSRISARLAARQAKTGWKPQFTNFNTQSIHFDDPIDQGYESIFDTEITKKPKLDTGASKQTPKPNQKEIPTVEKKPTKDNTNTDSMVEELKNLNLFHVKQYDASSDTDNESAKTSRKKKKVKFKSDTEPEQKDLIELLQKLKVDPTEIDDALSEPTRIRKRKQFLNQYAELAKKVKPRYNACIRDIEKRNLELRKKQKDKNSESYLRLKADMAQRKKEKEKFDEKCKEMEKEMKNKPYLFRGLH